MDNLGLTELPNRSLFSDRLEQNFILAEHNGKPFALLFIDLDDFKQANDKFGHDAGDLLLQLVAKRIHGCVRETDTVARLGGDEFTVILQEVMDTEQVEIVAGNILTELASPFHIFNNTVHVSASIGIALSSQDGSTSEDIIKNADQAMYAAKKAGRNRFSFFYPNQIAPSTAVWQRKVSRRNTRSDVINRRNEATDDRRGEVPS